MRDLIPLRLRVIVALAPIGATIALLTLAAGDAESAPASKAATALDAAKDAADAAHPDAHADAHPDAEGGLDARPDGRADAPKKPDAFLDARPDAPFDVHPEGGWFPDAPRPIAPDPVPLIGDHVFEMTVTFTRGAITIDKVAGVKLPSKQAVARHFGRFAVELYTGPTLLERVRFDFPLIEDDDYTGDVYARGLVTSVKVRVPDSDRPNKMEIWDRASDRRWSFEYPPRLTP